jgi:hypothetical protein
VKKVVVIENCFDCPHHDHRWTEPPWDCMEEHRGLGSRTGKIPRWCPLDSLTAFVANAKQEKQP